jgi:cytochrome c oxidase subunit 3|tara:strand:- start:5112 stop:5780 length:669 start_codon:yes stop_codon:yes gene_type:complete
MFATLREKPWLDSPQATASGGDSTEIMKKKIALRFFLAVVSVLFSLFIVTFLARSQFPDFEALAGQAWQPFTNATQLWINTAILFAASIAIQVALMCARKNAIGGANTALIVAAIFTTVFLCAQLLVWQQLTNLGYVVASNPANSYFYLFTAVHGMHLIGGLFVLARIIFRPKTKSSQASLVISTSLCASYWHYLLVVWLLLFALLTSTPATYKTLAALCGF